MKTNIFYKINIKYLIFTCALIIVFFEINILPPKNLSNDHEMTIYLSKLLTNSVKKYGQLSCKVNNVSSNGGWCSKFSGKNSSIHITDFDFARSLSKYLEGKKVASFGDGPGLYKEYILSLNQVNIFDAFDGAPFAEETTDYQVKFLDLSVPIYHLPKYDWIISIEVAEHIPKEFESIYVENLVRHASEGIIISWAHPGQTGFHHINEQTLEYVKQLFISRGFKYLEGDSQMLKESAIFPFIKNNLIVLKKI